MKQEKHKLPTIGARIIKSSAGVALCMAMYFIRSMTPLGGGMPFYSALAVLWCMQPYAETTKTMAKQRATGTLIGAAYGLAFLLIVRTANITDIMVIYLFASVIIVPIIYTTVLLNRKNASFFSCVVFLSIAITHSFDSDPYLFVFNRVLDTFVGILAGILLNNFHLPKKPKTDTLFVSGIDGILISKDNHLLPYSKVELNRLISSGVKFTVSTVRTPASLIPVMEGVNLQYPVIAMNGAVLYDISENRFLEAAELDKDTADRAEKIIEGCGLHSFVNCLADNTLLIYYEQLVGAEEKELMERLRKSPYRNYIGKEYRRTDGKEKVLYLMCLANNKDIKAAYDALCAEGIDKITRTIITPAAEYEGCSFLRIYSDDISKKNMLEVLKKRIGTEKSVTFGSIRGEYDIFVEDDSGNAAVKTLKRICGKG
ncbi:MAG: HAD hydrolase family protein [Eubacterium sp.]|nr:HAD hydrolase family protein [Eubacterium sp.]